MSPSSLTLLITPGQVARQGLHQLSHIPRLPPWMRVLKGQQNQGISETSANTDAAQPPPLQFPLEREDHQQLGPQYPHHPALQSLLLVQRCCNGHGVSNQEGALLQDTHLLL